MKKGMYILLLFWVVVFLIAGYCFILNLIRAIKGEVSEHLPAVLFLIWASVAILVTVGLMYS